MRIEPEQVLPQQWLSATDCWGGVIDYDTGRNEKHRAEQPIAHLHEAGRCEYRQSKRLQNGGDEHAPDGHRHAEQCHAGSAHVDDGCQIVDRAHHRREANERDPE